MIYLDKGHNISGPVGVPTSIEGILYYESKKTIFQLCHPGCAMEDLARCIWSSAQENVRREHLQTLFTHFYRELKSNLGKEPPFSFDLLMKSWYRLTGFGAIGGLVMVLMLRKVDPEIAGNPEKVNNMIQRARNMMEDALPHLD